MTVATVKTIAVFGNGLAGLLSAAKLIKVLPKDILLTYVEAPEPNKTDIMFGTCTSPSTYDFLLGLGITEPIVLPQTNTSFSLGTHYKVWGPTKRSWIQSFYRPLPMFNGVDFHHYLTRLNQSSPGQSKIETYIMSAQAAQNGVFAHPPEDKKTPLADVEYGYHFLPTSWQTLIKTHLETTSINWIKSDIDKVSRDKNVIKTIALSNGQTLQVDFVVDALGPASELRSPTQKFQSSGRKLNAISSFNKSDQLKSVCRLLTGTNYGWDAETPLQNGVHRLTVFHPDSEDLAFNHHDATSIQPIEAELGALEKPWLGNCLTLGHGAAIVEPLTPAPILLLQKDIDRLAELIPVTKKMQIESREYNRRFKSDYEHAGLFSKAFFIAEGLQNFPYWQAAYETPLPSKLGNKITQFKSRGVNVQYDYEPFNTQEWILQHYGMGRYPQRYDPLGNRISIDQLHHQLIQMKTAIDMTVKKMPPHSVYMAGLLKYLKDKHG